MKKKIVKKAQPKSKAKRAAPGLQDDDIITLILDDHKPLKMLIKVLKDTKKHSLRERRKAFEEFATHLELHAKPEERVLYTHMKEEDEMREEAYEGDVEHELADQMVEEAKRTSGDDDLWSARVKVLAELVEHHITDEEQDVLPDFRKHSTAEDRVRLGQEFLAAKTELLEVEMPAEQATERDVQATH